MQSVIISTIQVGNRHRKQMGDLQGLARSIESLGLLQPIGLDKDRQLIFGGRRLCAVRDVLGRDTIEARIFDLDTLQAEHDENEYRLPLSVSERVAIARALREQAGERRGRPADEIGRNCDQFPDGQKTDDAAARKSGLGSGDTLARAEKVVEQGTPELVAAMDAGDVSISAAANIAALAPEQQAKVVEAVKAGVKPTTAIADVQAPEPTQEITPTDLLGLIIRNDDIADAFAARETFESVIKILKRAQSEIHTLAIIRGGERYRTELQRRQRGEDAARYSCEHVKNAINRLTWAMPHASVCPYCHSKGSVSPDCRACLGQGWVTEQVWDRAPEDMRKQAIAARQEDAP